MNDDQQRQALFWHGLFSPLLWGEVPPEQAGDFLRQLAEQEHVFPDGSRRKVSRATLWRKWKQLREGGFSALARKPRRDRGQSRADIEAMLRRAVELKKDQPYRSAETINQFLQAEFGRTLPESTLYRHLRRAGATRSKLGIDRRKVRRRWTRDHSNALWVGDFADGPYVIQDGQSRATYLSAFIDCHSRLAVEARYYFRENFDVLIDSLLRAWASHGASRELYVDNAKIYHAQGLKSACAELNIRLRHRPVRDPATGGLVERFIQTCQQQFEREVRAGAILDLAKLNQALSAWLEVSYHQRVHSETKQTPAERYEQGQSFVRHVDVQSILPYFYRRVARTVDRDFSDVRLEGRFYRVDPACRGDKVEVRYDPFGDGQSVRIYSEQGEYLSVGRLHHREQGGKTPPPAPPGPVQHNYLDLLIRRHEQEQPPTTGIDFAAAQQRAAAGWPILEFLRTLASHLGRRGGEAAFTSAELEMLHAVHQKLPRLSASLLRAACEKAAGGSLAEIVFHLQQLASQPPTEEGR